MNGEAISGDAIKYMLLACALFDVEVEYWLNKALSFHIISDGVK